MNDIFSDSSQFSKTNRKGSTQIGKSANNQLYKSGNDAPGGNFGNLPNGNDENLSLFAAVDVSSCQHRTWVSRGSTAEKSFHLDVSNKGLWILLWFEKHGA